MDKATQKSIEWQKANNPMAIGGDAFADIVDSFNVNPAFVAGYKEAEKDTIERAVRWIAENTKRYVGSVEHPFWDMFLKHFRKYMEETK